MTDSTEERSLLWVYIKLMWLSKELLYFPFFSAFQKDKSKNKTKQKMTTITTTTTTEPRTAAVEECVRMDARPIVRPRFLSHFFKKQLETWARVSVRKIVDMDLENKISALKDFASFGSSSKGGPSSTRSNQSPQSTNSFSPQNGWGNWFAKGEKDPFLPSLVSFYKSMGRIRAFLRHTS